MGDLKTFWNDKPVPDQDLSGDLPTARGGDPNISVDGSSGLQSVWDTPTAGSMPSSESPNSVSGLPSLPSRFEPSGEPPMPPSLQDRNPGTIDQK